VLAAVTEQYSLFFLGRRTLESFRDFGILPAFGGVVVSDRYANYFHSGWEHIAGNQACLAHLIRDFQDAAECYPAAIWPVQAQRALRGLICGWHAARDAGQPEIAPGIPRTSAAVSGSPAPGLPAEPRRSRQVTGRQPDPG
jgi:transposase